MVKINPHNQSQPTSEASSSWSKVKAILLTEVPLPSMLKVKRSRPFSEDEMRARAQQIYEQRVAQGIKGTPEEDWQRAIASLQAEHKLPRKLRWLWQLSPNLTNQDAQKMALELEKLHLDRIKAWISALGLIATAGAVIGLVINYQQGQERLVTDRFAKAVEQLGSKESNVRIGAIYSLERIAKDSPKDLRAVMEVLTAYVRERSPVPKDWAKTSPDKRKELPEPSIDVQSVLTVINRRRLENDPGTTSLNLAGTNIKGADLSRANLWNANLSGANLVGARIWDTNLTRANLSGANLSGADLWSADFWYANLSGANLTGAKSWTDKQLSQADLCNTRLPYGSQLDPNRDCKELGINPSPSPQSPTPK